MTDRPTTTLTQHAMLVIWGAFAQKIGLIASLKKVKIGQRKREHSPQSKLIEFLVAILAGCEYLQDISHGAHPLDQDQAVAEAWGQPDWADYSGVSRTLKACSSATVNEIEQVLQAVSQPFIDQEVTLALQSQGVLVYDGDLTGRPVSNTSTSYPGVAFGWMSDEVKLGFQVALVSLHSPTYGRLWLGGQHHPGDVVSNSQAQTLVQLAEAKTGVRPTRRSDLLQQRLAVQQQLYQAAQAKHDQAIAKVARLGELGPELKTQEQAWQNQVDQLSEAYTRQGKAVKPYSQLSKARDKVRVYQQRQERHHGKLIAAQQGVEREGQRVQALQQARTMLTQRLAQFEADNRANSSPVRAIIRLDAGFGSAENIALLIELGYEVYSKPTNWQVTSQLRQQVEATTAWNRVGQNAEMLAWANQTLPHCPYPLDLALERFYTGETLRHSTLLHYDPVTLDLVGWFTFYNGRQTIEAGIKEEKGVFHLKHLFVQSESRLLIQTLFDLFLANFVRWAAHWLHQASAHPTSSLTQAPPKVKELVRIAANTSAWVIKHHQSYRLEFTDLSAYPGLELVVPTNWTYQLPLKLFSCKSANFSP